MCLVAITRCAAEDVEEKHGPRSLVLHVPASLPPFGSRALVVVLHGGLGSAQRIAFGKTEHGLNMDAAADEFGFIVAYLNGTPAARHLNPGMLAWNAGGGCCGQPAENDVDDVGYITGTVKELTEQYGINPGRIYGMGHSNGAMMTQRLMCETTLYAAIVAIAGPLNVDATRCPAARGKRILAIHGDLDANVPIAGGRGTRGLSTATYQSEAHSRQRFAESGASYELLIVKGADHKLDDIETIMRDGGGLSVAAKAAQFFGLAGPLVAPHPL